MSSYLSRQTSPFSRRFSAFPTPFRDRPNNLAKPLIDHCSPFALNDMINLVSLLSSLGVNRVPHELAFNVASKVSSVKRFAVRQTVEVVTPNASAILSYVWRLLVANSPSSSASSTFARQPRFLVSKLPAMSVNLLRSASFKRTRCFRGRPVRFDDRFSNSSRTCPP